MFEIAPFACDRTFRDRSHLRRRIAPLGIDHTFHLWSHL